MTPAVLALVLFLSALDFTMAVVTFTAFARPEKLVPVVARVFRRDAAWEQGLLDPLEEDLLVEMVLRLRGPMLAGMFAWSFLCGAVVAWVRL